MRITHILKPLLPSKKVLPAFGLDWVASINCGKIQRDDARNIYRKMLTWSIFDQLMNESQRQGRITFYLTADGEEGVVFGAAAGLDPTDQVWSQYRESGILFWRGYPMQSMIDQCFGNIRDKGKGRQMPVHYGSREHHFMTISGPLGTQIPQAAGAGYALKMDSMEGLKRRIAVCFFGEGAASEGDFHAGLNFAAVLRSHTLFIARNNQWAVSTHHTKQYAGDGIISRSPG